MGLAESPELLQHVGADVSAGTESGGLRQIQEHRGQQVVLVVQGHAAHEIRGILLLGEPARSFAAGAVARQHVHRRAPHPRILERVRMNGDEQIGALLPGDFHAPAQADVVITPPHQDRAHAALVLDLAAELFGDGEHHDLLPRALAADGAGILATVTGIDGDDQISELGGVAWRRAFDAFLQRLFGIALVVQIHHQAIAVLLVGLEKKAARAYGLAQIEYHAQIPVIALRITNASQQLTGILRPIDVALQSGITEIHHHPRRVVQHEQGVLQRTTHIEDDARAIRCRPHAHAVDGSLPGKASERDRRQDQGGYDAHCRDTVTTAVTINI